ncbi:MAG: dienelactone hydrolase family protein [Planctomycetota bacterium]|nr:dienelactone hydrolase family protein [Planctomycetota bacterium]
MPDRAEILKRMHLVLGDWPAGNSSGGDRRVPLDVKTLEETQEGGIVRRKITFAVEPGDRCFAWLLIPAPDPAANSKRRPAMLCLHQTTGLGKGEPAGLGGNPNYHYALELAKRGYVTLAPDCENFGEYKVDLHALGYASATLKNIWNHMRAVDLLASLPEVDPERIGSIGHSHGAHNSVYLAAYDPRVKVVVSSCGFTKFTWNDNEGRGKPGDMHDWAGPHYMPRIAERYGNRGEKMPFDMDEVLALIAPRALFVNAPTKDAVSRLEGVKECEAAVRPIYAKAGRDTSLVFEHPVGGHDFPPAVRQRAYEFIDKAMAMPGR